MDPNGCAAIRAKYCVARELTWKILGRKVRERYHPAPLLQDMHGKG
jgi:hypothetical protein